jgi:hypothetical protein
MITIIITLLKRGHTYFFKLHVFLSEYKSKCVDFLSISIYICMYIYIMSDISSRDSISMVFFFSLDFRHSIVLSTRWVASPIFHVSRKKKKRPKKDKESMPNIEMFDEEWFSLHRSSFNDNMSNKTNTYQSIIDVMQMQNDLI